MTSKKQTLDNLPVNSFGTTHVLFAEWLPQKKGVNPDTSQLQSIKYVKDVSCVDYLSFVQNVTNVLIVARDIPVGARLHLGASHSHSSPQRWLHPPFPDPTKSDKVCQHRKSLRTTPQEQLPDASITCTYAKECSRTSHNSEISWVLQQTFPGSKTQQPVETYLRPQYPEQISKNSHSKWKHQRQNQRGLLPYTISKQVHEVPAFSCPGSVLPVQRTAIWSHSVHSTHGQVVGMEARLIALQKGVRINRYLHDWLVRSRSHQTCLQHTQSLVAICQDLGWLVNMEKSELDSKQVFDFVGYQFDLKEGKV